MYLFKEKKKHNNIFICNSIRVIRSLFLIIISIIIKLNLNPHKIEIKKI